MSDAPLDQSGGRDQLSFTIPDFDRFGEVLHDRLHGVTYYFNEMQYKFMLITNYLDRDEMRIEKLRENSPGDTERLIYGGTNNQRFILEKDDPHNYIQKNKHWKRALWAEERNPYWYNLYRKIMPREGVETFKSFDDFRDGLLELKSVEPKRLKDYFKDLDSIFRKNEHPIIADYFDIKKDLYIGIPLLGMGLFQGIVWIVFNHLEIDKFNTEEKVRNLIRLFQVNYDNLLLDWGITEKNIKRQVIINRATLEIEETNPIQIACGLKKYYEIQNNYFTERINRAEELNQQILRQYNRTAIITILLDSFAHNISAHSLTALSWWFRERATFLESGDEEIKEMIMKQSQGSNPLIRFSELYPNKNLSRELYPLFKFLLEKGAFWSGITRQTNFTGKVSSLYNVLWYDFVNNPLYLGTIANTEEVRKLHINLTIYQNEDKEKDELFFNTKTIKKTSSGKLLDGTFATINLADFKKEQEKNVTEHTNSSATSINTETTSVFIEITNQELFTAFKAELERYRVFFPGGVIGKHAFFTLLENEIRNVKHYTGKILKAIQTEGLILNISIHERPIDSEHPSGENQLFKIGVWLKHPVMLTSTILLRRIEGLDNDILTAETSQPQLGGNYQDKICAAMLITNSFERVQDKETALGEIYYPWIKTAGHRIPKKSKEQVLDFEVSQRKYIQVNEKEFASRFESEQDWGYLKKYFHLWKGADILNVQNHNLGDSFELENFARFRFLFLSSEMINQQSKYQSEGIIRVISAPAEPENIEKAYQIWLPQWLKLKKGTQDIVFTFSEGDTRVGRISCINSIARFENYEEVVETDLDETAYTQLNAIPQNITLSLEHGGKLSLAPGAFNYRFHGELIKRFCEGKRMENARMNLDNTYELIEVLATRIQIFDRRIYNRLYTSASVRSSLATKKDRLSKQIETRQKDRLKLYRKNLFIDFRNETLDHFKKFQQKGFQQIHFLILHLSFIEGMKDAQGNTYSEKRIIDFIDDQILQGTPPVLVGNDFVLVITTGRGRMEWWDKIKEKPEYARFVTFRPIESILGVVEDALQMHDDFEMKFNMVKLLFGS